MDTVMRTFIFIMLAIASYGSGVSAQAGDVVAAAFFALFITMMAIFTALMLWELHREMFPKPTRVAVLLSTPPARRRVSLREYIEMRGR